MLRTIYGFDDLGRKVPTGSYDDGTKAVGGRIFYIDPNSDETVEFYDANGNVISNVAVGDTPSYYKVTSAGVSGKDKFYVYYDSVSDHGKYWTYTDNGQSVKEITGANSYLIGGGKSNTSIVMSLHDGAYADYNNTIWNVVKNHRILLTSGCDDWYIGSKGELEELRLYLDNNADGVSIINYFNERQLWSSSEDQSSTFAASSALFWDDTNHQWFTQYGKSNPGRVLIIRSF